MGRHKTPKSYNVIFSTNPQEGKNSKKSMNGFTHVFYKKHINKKSFGKNTYSFFVPTAFCIISEYPFYNSYYLLCNQILNLFTRKKLEIPLELILYNIINYTLSPINRDIILNLEPSINHHYNRVYVMSDDFCYHSICSNET